MTQPGLWVYIDQFQGVAMSASWEALGAACELSTHLQTEVTALVFGNNAEAIAREALACGASAAICCDDATLADFRVPTLASLGVTGTLADPTLEVIRQGAPAATATVASNDNWDTSLAPAFSSVGAFALNPGSRDAALIVSLPPGSYTAQVSGVGTGAAAQGVALVEVYELP